MDPYVVCGALFSTTCLDSFGLDELEAHYLKFLKEKNSKKVAYVGTPDHSHFEMVKALKEKGIKYKVGKLPFMANGKAVASNETVGFVKTLMGEHGEMLGAHIVGTQATELIHEYTLFS